MSSELLSFVYFNSRSVKNKLPDLHYAIYKDTAAHVFIVTESWLNETVTDPMLDPLNWYNILRYDRFSQNDGGGVVVLIEKSINTERICIDIQYCLIECVCFDFLNSNS